MENKTEFRFVFFLHGWRMTNRVPSSRAVMLRCLKKSVMPPPPPPPPPTTTTTTTKVIRRNRNNLPLCSTSYKYPAKVTKAVCTVHNQYWGGLKKYGATHGCHRANSRSMHTISTWLKSISKRLWLEICLTSKQAVLTGTMPTPGSLKSKMQTVKFDIIYAVYTCVFLYCTYESSPDSPISASCNLPDFQPLWHVAGQPKVCFGALPCKSFAFRWMTNKTMYKIGTSWVVSERWALFSSSFAAGRMTCPTCPPYDCMYKVDGQDENMQSTKAAYTILTNPVMKCSMGQGYQHLHAIKRATPFIYWPAFPKLLTCISAELHIANHIPYYHGTSYPVLQTVELGLKGLLLFRPVLRWRLPWLPRPHS